MKQAKTKKLMNTSLLLVLMALIIGLVGYLLVTTKKEPAVQEVSVWITKDGFEPSTVVVRKGTNIVWVNYTEAPQKIASNPYAVNTDLPGLMSGALGPRDEYAFTLDKTGTFGYHLENNPGVNGQIIVE